MRCGRVEVEDKYGQAVVYVDLEVPDEVRAALEPLVATLDPQQRLLLLGQLVRDQADEKAYERVCRAKGLLL